MKFLISLVALFLTSFGLVYADEARVWTNKPSYVRGDMIGISLQLPQEKFSSCDFFLTSPSGVEKEEGSGGCVAGIREYFDSRYMKVPLVTYVPSGEATSFVSSLVDSETGRTEYGKLGVEYGTWKVRVVAHQDQKTSLTLETQFTYGPRTTASSVCRLENTNSRVCSIFDSNFTVTKLQGCGPSPVDITVAYPGGEKKLSLKPGESVPLGIDSITVLNSSSPCSVNILNLRFDKPVAVDEMSQKDIDQKSMFMKAKPVKKPTPVKKTTKKSTKKEK